MEGGREREREVGKEGGRERETDRQTDRQTGDVGGLEEERGRETGGGGGRGERGSVWFAGCGGLRQSGCKVVQSVMRMKSCAFV